jgi:uncharacterized heparinase superfamily protein
MGRAEHSEPSVAARLLAPWRRARNRLWAHRSRLGPAPLPAVSLPEPLFFGDADRGEALLAGRWSVLGQTIALEEGTIWEASPDDARIVAVREDWRWLDDLAALGTRAARDLARRWTLDWIARYGTGRGPAWTPVVAGRRALRWTAHAALLVERADAAGADRFWRALLAQQRYLARAWPTATPGLARMEALAGLVWTGRVLPHAGHSEAIAAFGGLTDEMIDAEGGVASRRPGELAQVLALMIWTARVLEDGGDRAARPHLAAIVRAVPVLRQLRLGDGTMARFHGGGSGRAREIDEALAELRLEALPRPKTPMGYARLTGGRVALVMDAAAPPAAGHAGTLAFEMSIGRDPVVVNAGGGADFTGVEAAQAWTTTSHSTVAVAEASSARRAGGGLVDGPTLVSLRQAQDATGMWLLATQDGFVASHGLLHERRIFVEARGREVRGEEILTVTDARSRAVFDRVFTGGRGGIAARFHLHPLIGAEYDPGPQSVILTLPGGEIWSFRAVGGATRLEEGVYLDPGQLMPQRTSVVVVRAEVVEYLGQITWSFARLQEAPRAEPAAAGA